MTTTNQFAKRPIPVVVEFAQEPGQLETLEGPVQYQAGDALLTGVQGERWPVARAKFDSTYQPSSNSTMPDCGWYTKRFIAVTAYQVDEETSICTQANANKLHAKPGDWVVTAPDGDQWVVARDIFAITYIAISQTGAKP